MASTWTAVAMQIHGASVRPNGGIQIIIANAPVAVTRVAFARSISASTILTTGHPAGGADCVTKGCGLYRDAPAKAGTYYLWRLAQSIGGNGTAVVVQARHIHESPEAAPAGRVNIAHAVRIGQPARRPSRFFDRSGVPRLLVAPGPFLQAGWSPSLPHWPRARS
jgi:hypothetical protein